METDLPGKVLKPTVLEGAYYSAVAAAD